MSKRYKVFLFALATLVISLGAPSNVVSQDLDIHIQVRPGKTAVTNVSGSFNQAFRRIHPRNFTLLDDYGPATGLSKRFGDVRLFTATGDALGYRTFSTSERLAEGVIGRFAYSADLAPSTDPAVLAHVSWVADQSGLILLDDLLPQTAGRTARVKIELPAGWTMLSTEKLTGPNVFAVADVEKAVFHLASGQNSRAEAHKERVHVAISGEWLFSDDEARAMAESIFGEFERRYGPLPGPDYNIAIYKFPVPVPSGRWQADTRGRSVTIVASDMPFRSQSIQRLHEQLRHEIFHLWIPNGLNLGGSFDWFYEGFALYESLKLGVSLNRIRFDDYLDTLSRAINIDALESKHRSLIEASKSRWNGANTQLYARGILVAFACDLALLAKSGGKHSVTNVLRTVFATHPLQSTRVDGNTAILKILRGYPELVPIIDRNITGYSDIDWAPLLSAAGLELAARERSAHLRPVAKPSGRQRDLIDKLGYNSWRRLSGIKR
ncbi:MAG TPA: hypothetical protein VNA17_01350 [Pyrinomonadaceae bacterium]|nr:hypothetical protein [Pyrinomonadaceae bacterium]